MPRMFSTTAVVWCIGSSVSTSVPMPTVSTEVCREVFAVGTAAEPQAARTVVATTISPRSCRRITYPPLVPRPRQVLSNRSQGKIVGVGTPRAHRSCAESGIPAEVGGGGSAHDEHRAGGLVDDPVGDAPEQDLGDLRAVAADHDHVGPELVRQVQELLRGRA